MTLISLLAHHMDLSAELGRTRDAYRRQVIRALLEELVEQMDRIMNR